MNFLIVEHHPLHIRIPRGPKYSPKDNVFKYPCTMDLVQRIHTTNTYLGFRVLLRLLRHIKAQDEGRSISLFKISIKFKSLDSRWQLF